MSATREAPIVSPADDTKGVLLQLVGPSRTRARGRSSDPTTPPTQKYQVTARRRPNKGATGSAPVTTDLTVARTVRLRGRNLRVHLRSGTNPKPTPLLLCNGIGAAFDVLQPFVDQLDPAIDIIRFDVPGVGGSPAPALPYRFSQLAVLVMRMVNELGYRDVDVLGFSWGGALAQQIALQYPHRCRRLVLVSTGTGSIMIPGNPFVLRKMLTVRRFRDPEYAASLAGHLYGGSARTQRGKIQEAFASQRSIASARGYLYQLAAGALWTSLPFLPFIRQRTLIMAGDDDPIIPTANGRMMARLMPNAQLHIYQGGHVEIVSQAAVLAPVISDFLKQPESS